jgi:hypothetical protein
VAGGQDFHDVEDFDLHGASSKVRVEVRAGSPTRVMEAA